MFKYFDADRNLYAPSLKLIASMGTMWDEAQVDGELVAGSKYLAALFSHYSHIDLASVDLERCDMCNGVWPHHQETFTHWAEDEGGYVICESCDDDRSFAPNQWLACWDKDGFLWNMWSQVCEDWQKKIASVHHAGEQDEEAFKKLKALQVSKLADRVDTFRANSARIAEKLRVKEILATAKPEGQCCTPLNKEDAMSLAGSLSKQHKTEYGAFRFIGGHFVAKFIVLPHTAWYRRVHIIPNTDPVKTKVFPRELKAMPKLGCTEKYLNFILTCTRCYRNNRLCYPASSISYNADLEVSTYSNLKTAQLVAWAMSKAHPNCTIELCVSRSEANDQPYVVFWKTKPTNMDTIACYENGCERLMREARQMHTLTQRCVLNTWGVTWADNAHPDKQHNGFVQAASESEAWNVIQATEEDELTSIVAASKHLQGDGIHCVEINRMDSGSKKDDDEDNLDPHILGIAERWSEGSDEHCDPGYPTYRSLEDQDNDPDPVDENADSVITPTHSMTDCYERMNETAHIPQSDTPKVANYSTTASRLDVEHNIDDMVDLAEQD